MTLAARVASALRPPRRLSVADWADAYRILPRTSAEPGRWRTDRVPYMREIMDAMTAGSGVVEMAVMKASQVAWSEVINNGIGHAMEVDPGPSAIILPTQDTARQWVLRRLDPMLESTPQISAMIGRRRQNSDNSLTNKSFPGGFLKIAHAGSAAELASDAIRFLYLDEVDRFDGDVRGEGDPVQLSRARTTTFGARRRIVAGSTPVWDGDSRIQAMYLTGDQRRYHQLCPHCAQHVLIEWESIGWNDDRTEAVSHCPDCGAVLTEADRPDMLAGGVWVPTTTAPDGVRSYWIEGHLSPWQRWADMLRTVEEAVASGSTDRMRVVWNTVLGRPFRGGQREAVEWEILHARRGQGRRGYVPQSASILVAGTDVQSDRIEVEILAISEGWRQHTVDYVVLPGDPTQPQVWEELGALLERRFSIDGTEGATMPIARMALDTGYQTTHAYMFARRHGLHRVMAVKGTGYRTDIIGRPTAHDIDGPAGRIPHGVYLWPVGGDVIKDLLHHWLRLRWTSAEQDMPEGWCTWPDLDEQYFRGLCGEQRVQRGKRWEWEVIYKRNEPLDCRVYAIAAAYACGVDRWTPAQWSETRHQQQAAAQPAKKTRSYTDSPYLSR